MNRTQLINFLLRRQHGKNYLEIGVADKEVNFDLVNCRYKIGVGNRPGATFTGDADAYFHEHKEKFDFVFIDGLHTEKQVLNDIKNALSCLAHDGIIVLHDCMPPDEWHQREPEAVKEGEIWNGTVWKAALRVFNELNFECTLLDTDWGCGIINTSAKQVPKQIKLPDELSYKKHYPLLLNYKKSVTAFLSEHVKTFYHLACMGNWKEVFSEQMHLLKQNGFQWVDITVLGKDKDINWVQSFLNELELKAKIIFQHHEFTYFEKPAFLEIQEYAKKHLGYILYLHSKGVSNPADETKIKWRRLMMKELVTGRQQCAEVLHKYDAVGVNWRDMPPISHFCGNFWYAATNYLRRLPDFTRYYENPRYRVWDQISSKRLGCEFWIGSLREKPSVLSLVYRNIDFCDHKFWKDKMIVNDIVEDVLNIQHINSGM